MSGGPVVPEISASASPPRSQRLARLEDVRFDAVVVGGGITGAAVAAETARRGASVALIERDDFAAGASGHTSKLLHGGLRYLAQGRVRLVREALRERAYLLRQLDPTWVHPIPFLLPLDGDLGSRLRNRFGTWLYERIAGRQRLGPRRVLSRTDVLGMVPALNPEGLRGGVLYWEAIVDDVALTLFRVELAERAGAVVANHVEVLSSRSESGGGYRLGARDTLSGQSLSIRARRVVDATGAWMGRVSFLAQNAPRLMPAKGIHLVFRREKLPIEVAVVLTGPDARPTFVLPAGSLLIVGTTDTAYGGDPAEAISEPPDLDYLFRILHKGFPSVSFRESELVDVYAGVRPLLAGSAASTSELSREDVEASDLRGAVAVAGGKLTTHRVMAARAVELMALSEPPPSASGSGSSLRPPPSLAQGALPMSEGTELLARLVRGPRPDDWTDLRRRVISALTDGQAESLEDIIDRRLHALNRREAGFETVVRAVAAVAGDVRGWSERIREESVERYLERRAREYSGLGAG